MRHHALRVTRKEGMVQSIELSGAAAGFALIKRLSMSVSPGLEMLVHRVSWPNATSASGRMNEGLISEMGLRRGRTMPIPRMSPS